MTAHTDRDDDFGALDLDDMPGIPSLVRNARVAADLLFVDPPPAYVVTVYEHKVGLQGTDDDGIREWAQKHHLERGKTYNVQGIAFDTYTGRIEGVRFEVTVDVTR